jgi:vacuolar protein 8
VKDYVPFIKTWDSPEGGLKQFLINFLSESSGVAFQHIGVWTIEQFTEGASKFLQVIME